MPSSGLEGPWALDDATIDRAVSETSAGAYALGKVDASGTFLISYVGRSDGDVNGRLHDHAGKYSKFKCSYFTSSKAAFEKECNLYHDFNPPDNTVHPARPKGSSWTCPRCRTLG